MKRFIRKILEKRGYEIRQIETVTGRMDVSLRHLKAQGLTCQNILDVGANRTKWSRLAQSIFQEATFSLIEPQEEMMSYLEEFCKEFPKSTYFLAGAGANEATKTLTIWDDLQGSSFLPDQNLKLKQEGKQRQIEMITIDGLIETKKIKIPELMKLDIQGFELEALKGAKKTFGTTEVYILEVALFPFDDLMNLPVFSDVINFMLERNYVVYNFAGFLRRPLDGALGQCDICFVKKDGFLRRSNAWGL